MLIQSCDVRSMGNEMKFTSLILCAVLLLVSWPSVGQDFHIVFLNKKEKKAPLAEGEEKLLMERHLANIGRLAKEGKLWAAGPFDGGGGIFILKTNSMDSVKAWILTDPAVAANRWDVEMLPYVPRMGGVCQVGEKYEMTNYFFVRYHGDSPKQLRSVWTRHQEFLRPWTTAGIVIAEAKLGDRDIMLVMKEDPTPEKLATDPLVSEGGYKPVLKGLYIAKGSFCEPK